MRIMSGQSVPHLGQWLLRVTPVRTTGLTGSHHGDISRGTIASLATAQRLLFVAVVTCIIMAGRPAVSAPVPTEAEKRVAMRCVSADGKPVGHAEIYLFQYDHEKSRYQQFGPFTSDMQGAAVCERALYDSKLGNHDRWFYARVPNRLVGVARSAQWTGRPAFNPGGEIKLQPSTTIEGVVTVPPLIDVTKVTVRVRTMHVTTGENFFDYESFSRDATFPGLDTALPEIFECHPDAAGKIRFRDVPLQGRIYLVTAGAGLAETQWMSDGKTLTQPITLPIEIESALSGRVMTPDGQPAAGVTVSARISSIQKSQKRVPYLSTFSMVTNDTGEYSLHGLPQLELVVSINDPQKRWTFQPLEDLLLKVDEHRNLSLTLESGIRVSGRVTDSDGKPVAAAHLSAVTDSNVGSGLDGATTDSDGRYQLRLPSGKSRLYFNSLPSGFNYPDPQVIKHLAVGPGQQDLENLNFVLDRKSKEANDGDRN